MREFTACILVSGGTLGDARIHSVYYGEWWYFGRCENSQRVLSILASGGILGDARIHRVYSGEWWYFGRCENSQRIFW